MIATYCHRTKHVLPSLCTCMWVRGHLSVPSYTCTSARGYISVTPHMDIGMCSHFCVAPTHVSRSACTHSLSPHTCISVCMYTSLCRPTHVSRSVPTSLCRTTHVSRYVSTCVLDPAQVYSVCSYTIIVSLLVWISVAADMDFVLWFRHDTYVVRSGFMSRHTCIFSGTTALYSWSHPPVGW